MKNYSSEVNHLIENMHRHFAWFGQIEGREAEKMLASYSPNTFLLRTGENELHYFFSYVTKERLVYHKSIRINLELKGLYANSGTDCDRTKVFNTVEALISNFLECTEQELTPLSIELCQAQGF